VIEKAKSVALQLPFTAPTPLEFKLDAASDVVTLDRLRIVERLRELSRESDDLHAWADQLEREIREAGE
jgi:hypothetical protein